MPQYQKLGCHVALAGDPRAVVPRGLDNPVTYPELLVLQHVHGYDAVTDIYEIGWTDDILPTVERERLGGIYTDAIVAAVLPGAAGSMPTKGDFPTMEDIEEARRASEEALAKRKARQLKSTAARHEKNNTNPDSVAPKRGKLEKVVTDVVEEPVEDSPFEDAEL